MLVGVAGDMLLLAGRLFRGPISFSVVRKKWTYRAYGIKRRPMGCYTVSKMSQIWTLPPLTGSHCEVFLDTFLDATEGRYIKSPCRLSLVGLSEKAHVDYGVPLCKAFFSLTDDSR